MSTWNTEPALQPGEKPYEPCRVHRDWPGVPVSRWDTTLEVGWMHALGGDLRITRTARNTMASLYGGLGAAAAKFREQIANADVPTPGVAHPGNVGYWRGVAARLEDLAAEHWDHVRGRAHAGGDGGSWGRSTRVDLTGP
jgi:hypothetical protein